MTTSQQKDPDVARLSSEVDRDNRKQDDTIRALTARVAAVEDYVGGPLLDWLLALAPLIPVANPPSPPWN